ncbi:hypothetical protein [Flavobacterium psychrophilum]|uniref:hypothetical protein n=1 Tax=Flavobacterium psychrophilum TaxID=96345 RepID=UPI000903E73F|nr:hypothetical protein [Flavobacterium psychrophilum]EKT4499318.1 hypothetical protein [Flavobacterium psychrophilum]OJH11709.1 hypothetical protein FPG87_08540 [Flavobacterium psychrophilum]SNA77422.1 hypothetical protein DK150_400074 [Flavobacterium psychrophilum]SNA86405.1 hypothetical protein FI146_580048 [Flavobacterium psychrophilum]
MSEIATDKDKLSDSEKLDFFYEWAVWGHLSSKKDLDSILLKGHLMLETAIERMLSRNKISFNENDSFFRKLTLLEQNLTNKNTEVYFIINSLKKVNLMRNKLAHEVNYTELDNDIENWSKNIMENLKGEKFSKFTYRTRIVHSFSILTINLLRIKNYR